MNKILEQYKEFPFNNEFPTLYDIILYESGGDYMTFSKLMKYEDHKDFIWDYEAAYKLLKPKFYSTITYTNYVPDPIVQTTINNFIARAEKGEKKYGVTLDREDLSTTEWIDHAVEEHMDAILYLTKLKQKLLEKEKSS